MPAFDAKTFLANVSSQPGVYRMFSDKGEIIYVGKAKSLKKRLTSYFSSKAKAAKVTALVNQIANIEVTVTQSELEALLLEITLIKKHRPRYNVIFRDDKSYPYVLITDHEFPRILSYRGPKPKKGKVFGPYPNGASVREALLLMHKAFQLRQCEDSVFSHRTRPCLQHQIKRCSAPCVGYIDQRAYAEEVQNAMQVLTGKREDVADALVQKMEAASEAMQFEQAAQYRDQISALRSLQKEQAVTTSSEVHADVLAVKQLSDWICVELVYVREGRVLGNKAFFCQVVGELTKAEALSQFVAQYYLDGQGKMMLPQQVILSSAIKLSEDVKAAFTEQYPKVQLSAGVRGHRSKWIQLAELNAEQALISKCGKAHEATSAMQALQAILDLPTAIQRIECFDISHTQGEATVASCVVHNDKGMSRRDYRRFNIKDVQAGDDYEAMKQAIFRRYKRLLEEEQALPQLVFVDGGKGQLSHAEQALEELGVTEITLLAVSKGPERKAGEETFWMPGRDLPVMIPADHPAHLLIQRIRDEAHRFAITGHRSQRQKSRVTSHLEKIPGIGPKKRQAILNHFGGWQALKEASVEEISRVPGISKSVAEQILKALQ